MCEPVRAWCFPPSLFPLGAAPHVCSGSDVCGGVSVCVWGGGSQWEEEKRCRLEVERALEACQAEVAQVAAQVEVERELRRREASHLDQLAEVVQRKAQLSAVEVVQELEDTKGTPKHTVALVSFLTASVFLLHDAVCTGRLGCPNARGMRERVRVPVRVHLLPPMCWFLVYAVCLRLHTCCLPCAGRAVCSSVCIPLPSTGPVNWGACQDTHGCHAGRGGQAVCTMDVSTLSRPCHTPAPTPFISCDSY